MQNYKVYMHTFPNNKKYIGITRQDVNKRWQNGYGYKNQPIYEYLLEFGWNNIIHEVLYENLTKEEAQKKEKELIELYNSIEDGYNISPGGGVGSDCWREFEYDGIIYTAKELAELSKYNITLHDITNRINEHGWDVEKAINTPKGRRNVLFEYEDNLYSINELYDIRINKDLTLSQIRNRLLKHNWDVKRAISQSNNVKKQPKGIGTCKFEYNGHTYNSYELCQISKLEDLTPQDITDRINRRGWSIERAISQPKRKKLLISQSITKPD